MTIELYCKNNFYILNVYVSSSLHSQTTDNYFHQINGFYTEMMCKLKSLRNTPVLCQKEILDEVEAKTFKYLKRTPAVKEKLKAIEKFDNDIKETIEVYKLERFQRLEAQNEMCNEISRSSSFVDGQLFLELCQFEASDDATNNVEPKEMEVENPNNNTEPAVNNNQQRNTMFPKNFIKRNIELAKEGIMACCSLTDEEKKKLEDLLAESDGSYNLGDGAVSDSRKREITNGFSPESDDDSEGDHYYISNAYVIDDNEKGRMEDINSELEKFTFDETDKEKKEDTASKYDKCDWNNVLVEQRMKHIDAKLNEIRKSYEDEKAKANQTSSEDIGNESEASESNIDAKLDELYESCEYDEAKDDQISSEEVVNFSVASDPTDPEK